VAEFRTFHEGEPRPPTWAERERLQSLRDEGVEDVYVEPEEAPQGFWEALMVAVQYFVAPSLSQADNPTWQMWEREFTYATGERLTLFAREAFEEIVRDGVISTARGRRIATLGERFAAISHLLVVGGSPEPGFEDRVNDRAHWFRVGVRIENGEFIPLTSEHLHKEVVQPTLVLLSEDRFSEVDGLYRKAFDRVLSGDASGAITAATSAVEEMFRVLMPSMKGQSLGPLAEKARADDMIAPAVEEFVKKLYALRPDSDAHAGGTSDFDLGMLAIHISGSILLYLGKTGR